MRTTPAPTIRAAFWMAGAMASFMAMAISGRELGHELSTFQVLFFRSIVGLVVVGSLMHRLGWHRLRTPAPGTQLLRNVIHFAGQYGWFYGIALIPLTQVFALEFTMPIWTALLAPFILGERMTPTRALVVAIGFTGTLVVLRPGFEVVHAGAIAVLASALAYAIAHMLTKRLTATDPPIVILFYMTAIQLPLGLVLALPDWSWPTAHAWPWVVLVGVAALLAHYCMTRAFQLADATVVVPMDFLRLPLIAVVGYFFYGEKLDGWVLLGAAILCAGAWLNIRSATSRPSLAVRTAAPAGE